MQNCSITAITTTSTATTRKNRSENIRTSFASHKPMILMKRNTLEIVALLQCIFYTLIHRCGITHMNSHINTEIPPLAIVYSQRSFARRLHATIIVNTLLDTMLRCAAAQFVKHRDALIIHIPRENSKRKRKRERERT